MSNSTATTADLIAAAVTTEFPKTIFTNGNSQLLREILGIPIMTIIEGIAVTTGCGGGGLIVPTCIVVLGLSAFQASAMSQALMFGAASASVCIDWNRKEPNWNTPLIDMDIMLFMAPAMIAGAQMGALINRASPNWFILTALVIVLAIAGFRTLFRGYKRMQTNRENTLRRETMEMAAKDVEEGEGLKGDRSPSNEEMDEYDPAGNKRDPTNETKNNFDFGHSMKNESQLTKVDAGYEEQQKKIKEEKFEEIRNNKAQIELKKWGMVFLIWCLYAGVMLARGSKKNLRIQPDNGWYWVITFGLMFTLLAISAWAGYGIIQKAKAEDPEYTEWVVQKYTMGLERPKSWEMKEILFLIFGIYFAGIISGMVGIGGGMVLGPLMLEVGLASNIIASVNTTTILVSSSSLTLTYLLADGVEITYACFYSACCFIGAYVGKTKTKKYLMAHDHALIYIMAFVILSSWSLVCGLCISEYMDVADNGWESFKKFGS